METRTVKYIKVLALGSLLLALNACARIYNIDPEMVPQKNDKSWTVKSEPNTAPKK